MDNYNFVFENAGEQQPHNVAELLHQLELENFEEQFWSCTGRVAELGQEDGQPKLDWVNGLAKILANPSWLTVLLAEARGILADSTIKHLVWSGMGGSVMTLHCLKSLGLLDNSRFTLHILDSTDPAQLNELLQNVAHAEGQVLEAENLPELLASMLMIGVSMGMTSEEPITHLRWFAALLTQFKISPENHLRVLTLPNSYLHNFAEQYGVTRLNLQLDGSSNTPGRMSAPATKVFLLPLALQILAIQPDLSNWEQSALLQAILQTSQQLYHPTFNPDPGSVPMQKLLTDPFVQLGAVLAAQTRQGRNKVILRSHQDSWRPLFGWIEQLVEESLGKGGQGFLIFYDQQFTKYPDNCLLLDINNDASGNANSANSLQLIFPSKVPTQIAANSMFKKMSLVAAFFANFKKTIVTYAYLENIVFAGQPAVEGYKRYAREIRDNGKEIELLPANQYQARFGELVLDYTPLITRNLLSPTELEAEMQRLSSNFTATSPTEAPRYATLRDQRKKLKLLQIQMEQGIKTGEGVLEIQAAKALLRPPSGSDALAIEVSQSLIRRFELRAGDYIEGRVRPPQASAQYPTLVHLEEVNGQDPEELRRERTKAKGAAALVFAAVLSLAQQRHQLGYADLTFNGSPSPEITAILDQTRQELFNQHLLIPAKIRQAPQDYHSTEQSETDGPPQLVSLRLVAKAHAAVVAGEYSDRFLLAQALGTVAAMQDAGRWVLLLVLPALTANDAALLADLENFFDVVQTLMAKVEV